MWKIYRNNQNCQSVRLPVCAAHVALVAHGIVLPTIFASANRLATSAISWCTEFDLPACCLLPVASCLLLFAADDVGGGTVAVGCCDCCCCRLLLLLLCKRQNVSHLATCLARQWMSNILDRCKCQQLTGNAHTPTTLQHTPTHTQQHTFRPHSSGSFRWCCTCFLVMLPAACCCQRPDWPGKRQIRRTIALDFYLSNVYGPLAGQPVAQSSEPTPSTHTHIHTLHYLTMLCLLSD